MAGDRKTVNCPVNEQTANGEVVGRCYFHLQDGFTCPRHGNVEAAVAYFEKTGKLTLESKLHNAERA
ncbi:hypothetical protein A3709_19265 [Halioglobus sp. HI00S01]|uniref:hypothetical protein n=1 Tax=Halioglobus sp. HI00S01 TaxID=1822214 RepID=UPI0007C34CB7|nr:hypothetical protein [Halioglobus sp. HI00S01]KZX57764.1 hypothetical protein A3709_19265 [Halioglobus sp. HI00S01]